MARDAYFTAQAIYLGWNRLAIVLAVGSSASSGSSTSPPAGPRRPADARRPGQPDRGAVVFWVWTFPANRATESWTVQPETWEALQALGILHLAGAGSFLAMCALILAGCAPPRPGLKPTSRSDRWPRDHVRSFA
ncbi:MAG: hypothetical protein R3D28_10470 [Geminicoccaceae bacterium]